MTGLPLSARVFPVQDTRPIALPRLVNLQRALFSESWHRTGPRLRANAQVKSSDRVFGTHSVRRHPDGGIVYLTRYGRRVAAIVPADVAENYERMEAAYLSALADEARTDPDAPLSTAELIKELGLA
ncbi:MAG: hypothetical protein ACRDRL_11980 [Sciscionella sp.]